jgi:hypothetical protein
MTAATAPAASRPPVARKPGLATARLLRLELRHNAMLWMLPVAAALFWFITYRKAMAMPPLWNPRAAIMQPGLVLDFACPVAGAAAWMGSRDSRRHTTDLAAITARPRWARLLATWAATAVWAIVGCLACVAVLYGVTAHQGAWGGPPWWPAAVAAASMLAVSALGFAAGALVPSRFTAPLAAVVTFFAIGFSTQPIRGSQSYWQISPVVAGPWDMGTDPGAGTFYHYVPDLAIAQVMFLAGLTAAVLGALALPGGPGGSVARWLRRPAAAVTAAGLLAAGTAVALAGTGRMDLHGMIAIPALHDAASDRPVSYTPACSHTAIPVCLNPGFASDLPATAAALRPVLGQIAGLPGAPARVSQVAATYHQEQGNSVVIGLTCPRAGGTAPVFGMLLPSQVPEPVLTAGEAASQVRSATGAGIVASVTGDGPGASPAQHAVTAALLMAAGVAPPSGPSLAGNNGPGLPGCTAHRGIQPEPGPPPGTPAYAAARRFAALPGAVRHAWLARHLAALRAGRISLGQLP